MHYNHSCNKSLHHIHSFEMPGKTTSQEIRKLIVKKRLKGYSSHAISGNLNCPQSTVSRIIRVFKRTGNTEAKKSPGRPRKKNATMERLICRKSKADRFRNAKQISPMLPLTIFPYGQFKEDCAKINEWPLLLKKKHS